jgi:predicted extracellular nuclease
VKKTLAIGLFMASISAFAGCQKEEAFLVAFYNVENLFDTIDEPNKFDEQYLPTSELKWDSKKYNSKLSNLSKVISSLGEGQSPAILGLCEIENLKVLEDLRQQSLLADQHYEIIHFESMDARGIDNALLYNPKKFKVFQSGYERINLEAFDDTTRDIIWAKGILNNGDTMIVMVNHWPSRREGKSESEPKRRMAAKTLYELAQTMENIHPGAAILMMGDFNDEPADLSMVEDLKAGNNLFEFSYYNLMDSLDRLEKGSYLFRDNWNMLDQIIVNQALLDGRSADVVKSSVRIKDDEWLKQHDPKYEGYPFRTYGGRKYLDGYSDHFAVYVSLTFLAK